MAASMHPISRPLCRCLYCERQIIENPIIIQCDVNQSIYHVGDRWKPRPLGRRSLPEHPKHERFPKPRPEGRGAHRALDATDS